MGPHLTWGIGFFDGWLDCCDSAVGSNSSNVEVSASSKVLKGEFTGSLISGRAPVSTARPMAKLVWFGRTRSTDSRSITQSILNHDN